MTRRRLDGLIDALRATYNELSRDLSPRPDAGGAPLADRPAIRAQLADVTAQLHVLHDVDTGRRTLDEAIQIADDLLTEAAGAGEQERADEYQRIAVALRAIRDHPEEGHA